MPVQTDPDAALMLRVKRGDRAAFAELVDKYKQPLLNFIFRSLRDEAEAEDLAQNVFLQVYKSRSRYKQTAKFSTWLFTIARNLCLNEIRRRARHPAESLEETHAEHEEQPRQQFEDKSQIAAPEKLLHGELAQKIEEALAELPENQRSAILLCRQDELSYEEIAEILDCSLSATKSLIHRGRETLKEKLKPYLKTGDWDE
ncbi:MAG TPA: sigma-70 family RNA polymerase sigma factor [Verrucomicrobiae bacterium]|nr:sigma-70 family RNA polymerase sigma factor [Verrucomicrobiae bacterium]